MQGKQIASVGEFATQIAVIKAEQIRNNNKADLLFRGQPCDKSLLPKLGRTKTKGPLPKVERLLLKDFARASLPFREFEPKDRWDMLAMAQHHGLPTRLLDWTFSSLAALWFAVRNAPEKADDGKSVERGVVWVLCATSDDFNINLKRSPFDNKYRTRVFRPKAVTARIVAQSGVFTAHRMHQDALTQQFSFIPLDKNSDYKSKLFKFIVEPSDFSDLRSELNMFNANASLMFPDLDGLCAHLSWRYTKLADEETGPADSENTAEIQDRRS